MKNGIPQEMYYQLLDWKDCHLNEWKIREGSMRMCDFNSTELLALYDELVSSKQIVDLRC